MKSLYVEIASLFCLNSQQVMVYETHAETKAIITGAISERNDRPEDLYNQRGN